MSPATSLTGRIAIVVRDRLWRGYLHSVTRRQIIVMLLFSSSDQQGFASKQELRNTMFEVAGAGRSLLDRFHE